MPSKFMKNMLLSSHRHEKKDDDNASTMSRSSRASSMTLVNPDSFSTQPSSPHDAEKPKRFPFGLSNEGKIAVPGATAATNKTYPENAIAASHLIDELDNKVTSSGPHPDDNFLRICPHENLSFERLQRIVNLPKFKSSNKTIDAIGGTQAKEHIQIFDFDDRTCCPIEGHLFEAKGVFKLKYRSKHHVLRVSSVVGLELHVTWTLGYYKDGATREDIEQYLEKLQEVPLCSHKSMNDPWIIDTMYMIAHPPEVSSDPIDQWQKPRISEPSIERDQDCQLCRTHIKLSGVAGRRPKVEVTRILGAGVSKDDLVWRAQCGF